MENTYRLKIQCGNCYQEWDEEVEKGLKVIDSPTGAKVIKDEESPDVQEYQKELICPACGCKTETKRGGKK